MAKFLEIGSLQSFRWESWDRGKEIMYHAKQMRSRTVEWKGCNIHSLNKICSEKVRAIQSNANFPLWLTNDYSETKTFLFYFSPTSYKLSCYEYKSFFRCREGTKVSKLMKYTTFSESRSPKVKFGSIIILCSSYSYLI